MRKIIEILCSTVKSINIKPTYKQTELFVRNPNNI